MKFCFAFLPVLLSFVVFAQKVPEALVRRLQGKVTVSEIMKEVDAYYTGEGKSLRYRIDDEEEREDDYLFWKRWEWWMLSHLDEKGSYVNINKANFAAANAADKKWGAQLPKKIWAPQNRVSSEDKSKLRTEAVENAYGFWNSIGPTTNGSDHSGDINGLGRIDRIAFHPTNANIFYIGSPSGGLWKTTDGGSSWTFLAGSLPALGVSGIAISPSNGNVVYVLTGDGDSYASGFLVFQFGSSQQSIGVFKSTDGGNTWKKTSELYTGTGTFEGHRLAVSPTNGNFLFAATSQGLWRSVNGGNTWEQVRTGEYWDVKFKPNSDSTVYASTASGVVYSVNGGRTDTWNSSTFDFSAGSTRVELGVSANNANYVYALCGGVPSSGTFRGLFRSTNSGVSFTRRCNTPNIFDSRKNGSGDGHQSSYNLGITAKPTDANYVVTCALNVWRSDGSNGGTSMRFASVYREGQGSASEYIHPDVHAITYNPLNGYLYAGTDGGIYRSTDDGQSWTNLSEGVSTTQFYRFAMQDTDGNGEMDGIALLAGAQDNGIKYRSSGGAYKHVICCDGFGVAIAPNNANTFYLNINDYFAKSTNGGDSYFTLIDSVTFFSPIAIDYNNGSTVYLGGGRTRRSVNGFASVDANVNVNTRRVLVTCPSNSDRLYGSAGTNLIRSDDKADTWTTKSGNPGWPEGILTVNDIKASPANSLIVYACFGGYANGNKVVLSTNGGDTWTNWSGSLPNVPCYSLAVAAEGVYVGTEIGVFFRGAGFSDWMPFYSFMPRVPVTGLWVNSNGNIYASTFGRGMWFSPRKTACMDFITISNANLAGPFYFEANRSATLTLTAGGNEGTEIFVQAGDSVILKPGFEVKAGSFFKGYIAPCNSGGIPSASSRNAADAVSFPQVHELTQKRKPAIADDYWQIEKGKLVFHLTKKTLLAFYAKDEKGKLVNFYPSDILYPGLYQIPLPNSSVKEVELRTGKSSIRKLFSQMP